MTPGDINADLNAIGKFPHRRFNPLLREWVLVSPHRTQRPWLGKVEEVHQRDSANYDAECYLCPGNERAGGVRNPQYSSTFVFDNDYAALLPEVAELAQDDAGLLRARSERGVCRVVCFSPRHDLTIPRMNDAELRATVTVLAQEFRALESIPWIQYVQAFENRGELMGASNPHPHCQIWATESIPNVSAREGVSLLDYHKDRRACLLCAYLKLELARRERIVSENDAFVALVPYWAVWPFETMVLSRRHVTAFVELSDQELVLLGDILRCTTIRYDNLFQVSFPYSMGFHQRPSGGAAHAEWHLHAHYFPPLLRSATVQKFMVGFELLGTPQRDFTPESAADHLREQPEIHYLDEHFKEKFGEAP
jgi:UDPglucose--hexose-1-phosphate uridylyltransferase